MSVIEMMRMMRERGACTWISLGEKLAVFISIDSIFLQIIDQAQWIYQENLRSHYNIFVGKFMRIYISYYLFKVAYGAPTSAQKYLASFDTYIVQQLNFSSNGVQHSIVCATVRFKIPFHAYHEDQFQQFTLKIRYEISSKPQVYAHAASYKRAVFSIYFLGAPKIFYLTAQMLKIRLIGVASFVLSSTLSNWSSDKA